MSISKTSLFHANAPHSWFDLRDKTVGRLVDQKQKDENRERIRQVWAQHFKNNELTLDGSKKGVALFIYPSSDHDSAFKLPGTIPSSKEELALCCYALELLGGVDKGIPGKHPSKGFGKVVFRTAKSVEDWVTIAQETVKENGQKIGWQELRDNRGQEAYRRATVNGPVGMQLMMKLHEFIEQETEAEVEFSPDASLPKPDPFKDKHSVQPEKIWKKTWAGSSTNSHRSIACREEKVKQLYQTLVHRITAQKQKEDQEIGLTFIEIRHPSFGNTRGEWDSYSTGTDEKNEHVRRLADKFSVLATIGKDQQVDPTDPNKLTVMAESEFGSFTETPLTLQEFQKLEEKIKEKAALFPQNLILLFGSVAVLNDDGELENRAIIVQCGEEPHIWAQTKSNPVNGDATYSKKETFTELREKIPNYSGSPKLVKTGDGLRLSHTLAGPTVDHRSFTEVTTAGGRKCTLGWDICADHNYLAVKKGVGRHYLRGNDSESFPEQFIHLITSNTNNPQADAMMVDEVYVSDPKRGGIYDEFARKKEYADIKLIPKGKLPFGCGLECIVYAERPVCRLPQPIRDLNQLKIENKAREIIMGNYPFLPPVHTRHKQDVLEKEIKARKACYSHPLHSALEMGEFHLIEPMLEDPKIAIEGAADWRKLTLRDILADRCYLNYPIPSPEVLIKLKKRGVALESLFEELISKGRLDTIEAIIDHVDLNACGGAHSPFPRVGWAKRKNLDVAKLLHSRGLGINGQDEDGDTALMLAASNGKSETLRFLLKQNDIDTTLRNGKGQTALHLAVNGGRKESVNLLIDENPSLIFIKDRFEHTPLDMLANCDKPLTHNQEQALVALIQRGATKGLEDHDIVAMLSSRLKRGLDFPSSEVIQALVDQGFSFLAHKNKDEGINFLLDKGLIDVNAQDENGKTLLMRAIEKENDDLARLLIARKEINLTIQDKRGSSFDKQDCYTALHYAAEKGRIAIMHLLLERQPSLISIADKNGNVPLGMLLKRKHLTHEQEQAVEVLTKYGSHSNLLG